MKQRTQIVISAVQLGLPTKFVKQSRVDAVLDTATCTADIVGRSVVWFTSFVDVYWLLNSMSCITHCIFVSHTVLGRICLSY